jgi:hypothetical protein
VAPSSAANGASIRNIRSMTIVLNHSLLIKHRDSHP